MRRLGSPVHTSPSCHRNSFRIQPLCSPARAATGRAFEVPWGVLGRPSRLVAGGWAEYRCRPFSFLRAWTDYRLSIHQLPCWLGYVLLRLAEPGEKGHSIEHPSHLPPACASLTFQDAPFGALCCLLALLLRYRRAEPQQDSFSPLGVGVSCGCSERDLWPREPRPAGGRKRHTKNRVLTLVNAMQCIVPPRITASVFISDDAGLGAGRTAAPERTPVRDEGPGLAVGRLGRRASEAAWAATQWSP
jgi:hypothetical protein